MKDQQYTYPKKEHLCGKITTEELFLKGSSFVVYPIRIVFCKNSEGNGIPVRLLASVSKKRFKKAVDRNLVKRQIREAYRKNKLSLIQLLKEEKQEISLGIVYLSSETIESSKIEDAISQGFKILMRKLLQKRE